MLEHEIEAAIQSGDMSGVVDLLRERSDQMVSQAPLSGSDREKLLRETQHIMNQLLTAERELRERIAEAHSSHRARRSYLLGGSK